MAEKIIRVGINQQDLIKMQRSGWHVFKCYKCHKVFITRAHGFKCLECPAEKKGFIDFIKLLIRRNK